jgi:hypothetical protein
MPPGDHCNGHIWIGSSVIDEAKTFMVDHADSILLLVNAARERYAQIFSQEVKPATRDQLINAVQMIFTNRPLALNLACLITICLSLEAEEDFDNLVVDEILGSRIAEMIAATEPGRTYSQATFHILDVVVRKEIGHRVPLLPEKSVAADDLLAGLAAGFETILPGWAWMERQ